VIGFNVVYQQFRAMYDSGCVRSAVTGPDSSRSTMPQICPTSPALMMNVNQGSSRCQFLKKSNWNITQ